MLGQIRNFSLISSGSVDIMRMVMGCSGDAMGRDLLRMF